MTSTDYQASIIRLTKRLMALQSVNGQNAHIKETLGVVKETLQGYYPIEEFESEGIPSILIHNTRERTKRFAVILNAHVDVVPGDKKQFTPVEKNGKIFGRGAFDMKAAAAVMILLFKEVAKRVPYPLALQIVTDEETGGQNGTAFQVKKGIRGDFVIFGESTNLSIFHQSKGRLALKLTAKGKSAHSGYPWLGDNAILRMYNTLSQIKNIYAEPRSETWRTLVNIIQIGTSNSAVNKIPDDCFAYLDVRFIHEDQASILSNIVSLLPDDITYEVVLQNPPHFTKKNNIHLQRLQTSVKSVLGKETSLIVSHGFSDLSYYSEVQCAGVEFGPMGGGHHSSAEWVDGKSLLHYHAILKNFLFSQM